MKLNIYSNILKEFYIMFSLLCIIWYICFIISVSIVIISGCSKQSSSASLWFYHLTTFSLFWIKQMFHHLLDQCKDQDCWWCLSVSCLTHVLDRVSHHELSINNISQWSDLKISILVHIFNFIWINATKNHDASTYCNNF